jgi:hypothetical protein
VADWIQRDEVAKCLDNLYAQQVVEPYQGNESLASQRIRLEIEAQGDKVTPFARKASRLRTLR